MDIYRSRKISGGMTVAERGGLQRTLSRRLQGAILFAAVAACLAALLLLAAPVLLRRYEVLSQSTAVVDQGMVLASRGAALFGIACVALMLGALVWTVRIASRILIVTSDDGAARQDLRVEQVPPHVTGEKAAVEERWRSLAERALAVSRATTGILDMDVLVRRAVDAISGGFLPVCAGLFLVDDAADTIVLRAGVCENGESIVPQGYGVGLDQGRLGWCIANARSCVSSEAVTDLLLRVDPELRSIRTEAVVPLRDNGRAIGALVLQDREPDAFDEDTLSALQGIADQLGGAVGASHIHAATQVALQSAREALRQTSQDALRRALPGTVTGYQRLPHGRVEPVLGGWEEDMARAVAEGRPIHQDRTLVVPIRIRDAAVGAVRLQKPETTPGWSEREIDLARTAVEHLGHALESACLYAEVQSINARTALAHEVSERLSSTEGWDALMQTAVQEIARVAQASRVFIQWVPPTSDESGPGLQAELGGEAKER